MSVNVGGKEYEREYNCKEEEEEDLFGSLWKAI